MFNLMKYKKLWNDDFAAIRGNQLSRIITKNSINALLPINTVLKCWLGSKSQSENIILTLIESFFLYQ